MFATFSPRQKRVLIALVFAYSSAYVCRTNISMMLPGIMADLRLSQTRAGTLTTLFAVIYAVGQVINGMIVDRVNPRMWIFTGLTLSAACNLLCAGASSYAALLALWSLNAIFQSMLWTPVVRIVAQRFDEAKQRSQASFALSFALIFGNLTAWGVAGLLISRAGWRAAFVSCAAVTLAVDLTTFFLLKGEKPTPASSVSAPAPAPARREGLARLTVETGLALVLLGCLFNGFVRDSIMTWAPTILMDTQGIDLNSVLGVALIIPAVNLFGVLLGRFCYGRMGRMARRSIALLTVFCALFAVLLAGFAQVSTLLCGILLAGCVALTYGVNPLFTSLLPLEYYDVGRVGTVAGLVDAFIYIGSGLSGVVTGALAEHAGWTLVFLIWAVGSVVGATALRLSSAQRYMDRLRTE